MILLEEDYSSSGIMTEAFLVPPRIYGLSGQLSGLGAWVRDWFDLLEEVKPAWSRAAWTVIQA